MKISTKNGSFATLGILLLSCTLLVVFTSLQPKKKSRLNQPLAQLLPQEISGWTISDQPIATTEEMKKAIGEVLNYDDAIFRTYSKGSISIAVYIAYWKPGKMSARLIAGHTPDVCWVANGWRCAERNFSYQATIPNHTLRPAQAGIYELSGNIQHVLFWHLQGDRLVTYNKAGTPPWWAFLTDLWEEGLNQRGEQVFIRVSGNLPVEQALQTSALQNALEALGAVGLY